MTGLPWQPRSPKPWSSVMTSTTFGRSAANDWLTRASSAREERRCFMATVSSRGHGGSTAGPLRLPGRVFRRQQVGRPVAEPVVAVAALVPDVGQVELRNAVTVGEQRTVGADLVEPGPQRRG